MSHYLIQTNVHYEENAVRGKAKIKAGRTDS